ncbi:MAG: glycosyltransferase [Acidobacteriaceae bacterium]|nr:glycosyltransferase [Acidobacteriaceae bacterium]
MLCKKSNHIAIYHTWPKIKNAEYEVITRIIIAAKNIDLDVTIIDNDGYVINSTILDSDGTRVDHGMCDFAISFHFESPKVIDFYTYIALWNPLEFYFMFGYDPSIAKLISHDDVLSCDSDLADAHALNLFGAIDRPVQQPLPKMFHSVSQNVIEPHITSQARLFYIGINWERINNTRGRHHDLLVDLDKTDMLDLYGPEIFEGVRPWEGFDCYRGSLPFDGISTIERIADAGICLAFSSAAHQRTGIMSNRLFEGLAAGAFVIANTHPFLEKHFGNLIATVDDSQSPEKILFDVKAIISWVRRHPEQATEQARAAQKIFLERFPLEKSLLALIEGHGARASHIEKLPIDLPMIDAILVYSRRSFNRLKEQFDNVKQQLLKPSTVFLILDETWYGMNANRIAEMIATMPFSVKILTVEIFAYSGVIHDMVGRKRNIGPTIWNAISMVTAEAFIIMPPEEDFFHDHFSRLGTLLMKHSNFLAVGSGVVIEEKRSTDVGTRYSRRLGYLAPPSLESYLYCNNTRYSGSHLYRRSLRDKLSGIVFELCDGQEHNYLNGVAFLVSGVGWSQAATLVYREHDAENSLSPTISVEQQHQFIRDSVRSAPARFDFLRQPKLPDVIFSTPLGNPIQWDHMRQAKEIGALMEMGVTYTFTLGGSGLKYLASGFSQAESVGTWTHGKIGIIEFSIGVPENYLTKPTWITLTLELWGVPDKYRRKQSITVMVNGNWIGHQPIGSSNAPYDFPFKSDILEEGRSVRLKLICDHAEQTKDDSGAILDARFLGVMVRSIRVDIASPASLGRKIIDNIPQLIEGAKKHWLKRS